MNDIIKKIEDAQLKESVADFMKQLYEHFYLEKNEIKKLQKIYLLNCYQALDGN